MPSHPTSAQPVDSAAPVAIAHGGHRPQLDALRCFAVAGVLVTHFWQPNASGMAGALDLGFFGVRLFFVLSGFLITGILLDARDGAERSGHARGGVMKRFYVRRMLRIFPLYYAIVLGGLIFGIPNAREAWPWLLGYASNFYETLTQRSTGHYGHFWTLAVEEQFYLVWPWLVLFAPRRWLAGLMLAAVGSAVVYRDLVRDVLLTDLGWGALPIGSLDTLAVGGLLALAFRASPSPDRTYRMLGRVTLPLGLAGYVVLHLQAVRSGDLRALIAGKQIAFALVCCWVIARAYGGFSGAAGRILEARPIVYLGRISYGIYAYHMLLPWVLARVFARAGLTFPAPGAKRFVIASAATVAIAAASWHLFEAPINALKRHVRYEPAVPSGEPHPTARTRPVVAA
jgi:peptidoglycan/LPS O-acetylase OafA/YrhL